MIINGLIISLMVLFLHFTSQDGEIFEGIKKLIPPKGKIYKAIYGCPACMCFWYGNPLYVLLFNESIKDWFITLGAACGFSVLWVVFLSIKSACAAYIKEHK